MKWASEKNVFSFVTLQLTSHPNDGPMIIGNIERAICVVCNAMWLTGSANSFIVYRARVVASVQWGMIYILREIGSIYYIVPFHCIALHFFFSSMFFFRRVARATSHSKLDMGLMWIWHGINLKIMQIGLLAGCQRAKSAFSWSFFLAHCCCWFCYLFTLPSWCWCFARQLGWKRKCTICVQFVAVFVVCRIFLFSASDFRNPCSTHKSNVYDFEKSFKTQHNISDASGTLKILKCD